MAFGDPEKNAAIAQNRGEWLAEFCNGPKEGRNGKGRPGE
jgi:hypothetical protein